MKIHKGVFFSVQFHINLIFIEFICKSYDFLIYNLLKKKFLLIQMVVTNILLAQSTACTSATNIVLQFFDLIQIFF